MSDRRGADSHQDAAASDDPLFELARIVSGRGAGASSAPASPPPPLRGRPQAQPEPARPAAPEPDILGDLEAELLSDLQASFAAVKEAIEPAEPPPAPKVSPQPPVATAPPPSDAPPAGPARPPQPEPSPLQPSSPPVHAAPPAQQSAAPRVSGAARAPIQQMPPRQPAAPAAPPPRERPHAPPPVSAASAVPAEAKKVEVGNFNLRPTAPPQVRVTAPPPPTPAEKPAPAAAKPSRWERPAEPPKPQASAASRFAPPRAAEHHQAQPAPRQSVPPPTADEEDLPFDESLPFAHEGEDAADEFPLDAFDIVPGYGDDAEMPPYPDDELEPLRKRGVPRSLVAIAGILALVLIGVLGFVMLRPGVSGGGTPPIISADAGPTKIAPPEPPSTSNGGEQNKLIYDRVDSGPGGGPVNSNLVTPGSEPIAPVPSTNTDNPIARVILPGGPTPGAPGSADAGNSGADVATNEGDSAQSIGPRKVRTVVVRPDGTIVSSDAVPAEGDAPASTDATPAPPATAEVPAAPPVATNDDTAAIAGTAGQELAITPNPGKAGSPAETPAPPAAAEAQTPIPTPTPTPKPTKPKVVATGGDGGPIDLTPGNGKSTTVVASATPGAAGGAVPLVAGGMMVQVSSQRSQDAAQATFRDLQARYPGILGGYDANIQRADLGDRGIYYRVRVGPFASANAQGLCAQLKSAGGNCILAPR